MTAHAKILIGLQTLFFGRVLGQILVALDAAPWLPAFEHWYSGLLPYPLLLPAQIVLLMFLSLVTYDACRQDGHWHVENPATKDTLRVLAIVYFTAMLLRYVLTMALVPDLRWHGHGIPIVFHFVLASYVLVLSLPAPGGEPAAGRTAEPGLLR